MTCYPLTERRGKKLCVVGHLCITPIYEYGGCLFEWHSYCGPEPLRRDTLEPRTTIPKGFWKAIEAFQKLSEEEREKYLYDKEGNDAKP